MCHRMIVGLVGIVLSWVVSGNQQLLAGADSGLVVVVAQDGQGDFSGTNETPILAAIKKVRQAGGGTVRIEPGSYLIRRGIRLTRGITITGTEQTVLKLASPVIVTAPAKQGQDFILVDNTSELVAGTSIEILPPPGMKTFPDTDQKELVVEIREIEQDKLILSKQIPHAIAEKSRAGYQSNLFFVGGSEKDIRLESLVLDGGRRKNAPMPGHCDRCALLAHGIWSYKDGPTAPPIENVQVVDCHIRNCYGRAVAMYSVVRGKVADCLIEDINDEAIDLDHFCHHCQVTGNTVKRCHTGVTINDGSYCTIRDNRLERCGVGVTMWWWYQCPQENLNVENVIQNNVIISPKKAAISLGKKCLRNQIIGNVVEGRISVADPDNVVKDNSCK